MDPGGNLDTAHGMIELVVGTGGVGEVTSFTPRPNSAVREMSTFGVMKLTLRAHDFDWQFIPVAGKTFTDSGHGQLPRGTLTRARRARAVSARGRGRRRRWR